MGVSRVCRKLSPKISRKLSLLLGLSCLTACSPSTSRTTSLNASTSTAPLELAQPVATQLAGSESMLTLPSWCSISQVNDQLHDQLHDQLCFRCERPDGAVTVPYEQCLTPGDSFNSARDCSYDDGSIKKIHCIGTSDDPFSMNVSLASEKFAVTLPAYMMALESVVKDKFPGRDDIVSTLSDLKFFVGSRAVQIAKGEETESIASDLTLLIGRHFKLSESQASFFRDSASISLAYIASNLVGTKDYNLAKITQRALDIAGAIPSEQIGDNQIYLTGRGLASLLSNDKNQHLKQALGILQPENIGITSIADYYAQLRSFIK